MTAYGRTSFHSNIGDFVVEIQSVNRKFLEINMTLPKELSWAEIDLKKLLLHHIYRGQITVKISVAYENTSPLIVHPNLPLARQIKNAWDTIAKQLNLDVDFDLNLLANVEDILLYEDNLQEEDRYLHVLKEAVLQALEKFNRMKLQEGTALQADILERTNQMRQWIKLIEHKAPLVSKKYRDKILNRLQELTTTNAETDERLLKEVALFAEKVDITEEITRFFCHLTHFEELIQSEQTHIGKTLEFVLQELNREINTIGSKASEIEISRVVIDVKSELERIREQIQNVE